MLPVGVFNGHHDEYWNETPGASTGCSPTTPGPFTSRMPPKPSVMTQWRLRSWTVSRPRLEMRIVYSKTHSPGREFSAEWRDRTSTRIWFVIASETGASSDGCVGICTAIVASADGWRNALLEMKLFPRVLLNEVIGVVVEFALAFGGAERVLAAIVFGKELWLL